MVQRDISTANWAVFFIALELACIQSDSLLLSIFNSFNDEVNKQSGVADKKITPFWTPGDIKLQQDFLDLIPHINEANAISIEMNRKIKYTALSVPADV